MHVVAFIARMLSPLSHAGVPSICAVEPIATWIVHPVMVTDAAVAVTADVAGDGLAGGIGVDLVAISGCWLGLTGGCKNGWWQRGVVC